MNLTIKQENFCNYYIETGNASEAYRRAYSCGNMKDETVNVKASELLNSGKVSVRVELLQRSLAEISQISALKIAKELEKIAFSSIAYLHDTWIKLTEFEDLTDDQKACIRSISTKVVKENIGAQNEPKIINTEYVKLELYDKLKALGSLIKMFGYHAPAKQQISRIGDKDPKRESPLRIEILTNGEKIYLGELIEKCQL